MQIKLAQSTDINGIQEILSHLELFPPEMLEEMMHSYLNERESKDIWGVAVLGTKPQGFVYAGEEMLAPGTYNVYALGVHPDAQSQGLGKNLMEFVEREMMTHSARIAVVETSSKDMYEKSRAFYEKLGYVEEARIREFWGENDDKVVYWKKIALA